MGAHEEAAAWLGGGRGGGRAPLATAMPAASEMDRGDRGALPGARAGARDREAQARGEGGGRRHQGQADADRGRRQGRLLPALARRQVLPVQAARLRPGRHALVRDRATRPATTPSRCAACARSSRARCSRTSTSASCRTSPAARRRSSTRSSTSSTCPRPSSRSASSSRRSGSSGCSRQRRSRSSSAVCRRSWSPRAIWASRSGATLREGLFSYAIGAFNGARDSGNADVNDIDSNDSKDVVARIFAQPFLETNWEPLRGLGVGMAVSYGNEDQAAPSFRLAYDNANFFNYLGATGGLPAVTADGEHLRLAPQGTYYWGPFGMLWEYTRSSQRIERGAGKPHHRRQSGLAGRAQLRAHGRERVLQGRRSALRLLPRRGRLGRLRSRRPLRPALRSTTTSSRSTPTRRSP